MKRMLLASAMALSLAQPAFAATWWVGFMDSGKCALAPMSPGDIVDQMNGEVVLKNSDGVDISFTVLGITKDVMFYRNKETCDRAIAEFKSDTEDLH
jgi:hypothetical protein